MREPSVRDSSGKPTARNERGLAANSPTPDRLLEKSLSCLIEMPVQQGRGHAQIMHNVPYNAFNVESGAWGGGLGGF